jgi:hypothetical protein
MTETEWSSRVFVSGERVEPGLYRDLETGAIVRIYEPDELPDHKRIVRTVRLFLRLEEARDEDHAAPILVSSGR